MLEDLQEHVLGQIVDKIGMGSQGGQISPQRIKVLARQGFQIRHSGRFYITHASRYVDDIQAELLVLHDRDDQLVPSAESRRLAAAMQERGRVRYTELLSFEHVRPTSGTGVWQLMKEGFKLYRHMYRVMRAGT